jgi:Xaa-Pro aminopeptidase
MFFPHGIGHMVGLGVRDAGGYLPGRKPSTRSGLANLRTDLPLEPRYAMTIEPGVYFIPALLDDPENRAKHGDAVAWDRVDALRGFGGIRIEDNVVVTDGAPEVVTAAVPKSLDTILANGG